MLRMTEIEKVARSMTAELPEISGRQYADAFHADGVIYVTGKFNWCTGCNTTFEDHTLRKRMPRLKYARCPHCGRIHKLVKTTANKEFTGGKYYFTTVSVYKGYQVIRNYLCTKKVSLVTKTYDFDYITKRGFFKKELVPQTDFCCTEVSQIWFSPDFTRHAVIGRSAHGFMYYDDCWKLDSPMKLWQMPASRYYYSGYLGSGAKLLPVLRQHGLNKLDDSANIYAQIDRAMNERLAESMLKHNQNRLFVAYCSDYFYLSDKDRSAIRVAMRHGYKITDPRLYKDYLDDLDYLGLDMHNPHYICPDNLREAHAEMQRRRAQRRKKLEKEWEKEEQKRKEQRLLAAKANAERYRKRMAPFSDTVLKDQNISISALLTVEDVKAEGESMHHCVFMNEYFNKEESLLLSAKVEGERMETVEFDIRSGEVLQSRGKCNACTAYHDRIVDLVKSSAPLLRRLACAGKVAVSCH